ncbi:hypothetical protein ZWY2020_058537 [Hordeum vulgare]|nr:hypothetical protein ZWY2020_058537 [Hordeum vulgare]
MTYARAPPDPDPDRGQGQAAAAAEAAPLDGALPSSLLEDQPAPELRRTTPPSRHRGARSLDHHQPERGRRCAEARLEHRPLSRRAVHARHHSLFLCLMKLVHGSMPP